eukprot:CAMPEP_0198131890 /NCGR_PEP_ID=MMETSP1442-20131203/57160_1 /TAXON_ID= /ORGANISM="Craspedostauros australis, Strain CCMP3328" /LENGTH=101 /DNA_ID=CAMNT_0043792781 /DNA_START=588 /DNA_END=890 /DNA_ORIENTATION=+
MKSGSQGASMQQVALITGSLRQVTMSPTWSSRSVALMSFRMRGQRHGTNEVETKVQEQRKRNKGYDRRTFLVQHTATSPQCNADDLVSVIARQTSQATKWR